MLCVVVACSRCELIRQRLRHIPASPVHWGRFLAGVVAAVWAATLWGNGPGMDQLAGIHAVVSLVGRMPLALWMTVVAVVPVVDVLTNLMPLRVFGATLGLVTWSTLLVEMVLHDGALHPAIGDCLVGLLGCLNANIGLAHQAGQGRQ